MEISIVEVQNKVAKDASLQGVFKSMFNPFSDNFTSVRMLLRLESEIISNDANNVLNVLKEYAKSVKDIEHTSIKSSRDVKHLLRTVNRISAEASYYMAWLRELPLLSEDKKNETDKLFDEFNKEIAKIAYLNKLEVSHRKVIF
ncbi:MAG: hypothetical protein ACP5TL_02815 [Candidatus Micrarchaeia archaeon]